MKFDFKKAICSPFSNHNWILSIIVLSSFYSAYTYNCLLIELFLLILLAGYYCQFAYNQINDIYPSLPEWIVSPAKYLRQGFMCLLSIFIFFIILSPIILIIGVLASTLHNNVLEQLFQFSTILGSAILTFFIPCVYASNFIFKEIFNFNKIFKIIINAKLEFLLSFFIYFIFYKICILFFNYAKTILVQIFLGTIVLSVLYPIIFNLFIQSYRLYKENNELKNCLLQDENYDK